MNAETLHRENLQCVDSFDGAASYFDSSDLLVNYEDSADGIEVTALGLQNLLGYRIIEKDAKEGGEPIFQLSQTVPVLKAPERTSTIIELFEGVVQSTDCDSMHVLLRSKKNQAPDHVMSIGLDFVQPQDRDLVSPGAVFYLTLFKETTGRTIRNSEEIRFRRQPDWNRSQIARIKELAAAL